MRRHPLRSSYNPAMLLKLCSTERLLEGQRLYTYWWGHWWHKVFLYPTTPSPLVRQASCSGCFYPFTFLFVHTSMFGDFLKIVLLEFCDGQKYFTLTIATTWEQNKIYFIQVTRVQHHLCWGFSERDNDCASGVCDAFLSVVIRTLRLGFPSTYNVIRLPLTMPLFMFIPAWH